MKASDHTFVIAEAGVNHNGSLTLAHDLVRVAVAAGADAVKFQTFDASKLVLAEAAQASYQVRNTGSSVSQQEMLRGLQLGDDEHLELKKLCDAEGIEFMSSPFDPDSVDFLAGEVGVKRLKIPSGEIINGPLMLRAARTGLPLIVSTGMCTLDEVLECLSLIVWAYENTGAGPRSRAELAEFRQRDNWTAPLVGRVSLLQCVTQYPAPAAVTNLRAMDTLRDATGLVVGLSDHSLGRHVAVASIAAGARIIEKHFTLSRSMPGPDHIASLEPGELKDMIQEIRDIESALGDGVKKPNAEELENRTPARGSLVAAAAIKADEAFSAANLTIRRPGNGVAAAEYWNYVNGKKASRGYAANEQIEPA